MQKINLRRAITATMLLLAVTFGAKAQNTINLNDGQVYTDNITLTGAPNKFVVTSGTATISGVISGTVGNLTKLGAGTLILTGTNTYTGATNVSAGTLQIGDGTSGIGSILTTSNVVLTDVSSQLVFNRPSIIDFLPVISGAGSVTQNASGGTLRLKGDNTYTGLTTVSGGSIQIQQNGRIAGDISVATGATLAFQSTGEYTYSGVISGAGNVIVTASGTPTLSGANTATGTFTLIGGAGILALSNWNWAGNFVHTAGILDVKGNVAIGGNLTLNNGTIKMDLTSKAPSKIAVAGTLTTSGTTTLDVTANGIKNQVLLTAASGVSATPFALNLHTIPTAILSATSTELKLIDAPAGIAHVQTNNRLQVYVNNGELTIKNAEETLHATSVVTITDLSGRTVLFAQNGAQTININTLPQGVYLVRVGDKTGKFIKQ